MRRGLGLEEVQPRLAHLLAHELGVLARGLERRADLVAIGPRRADELGQELRHPPLLAGGHVLGDPGSDLVASLGQRRVLVDPERPAQRLGEQVERGPRAQRVAATDPDRDLAVVVLDAAHELGAEPRLAHPRRRGHERAPRLPLVEALVEDLDQHAELPVTADARGRPAQQRPGAL